MTVAPLHGIGGRQDLPIPFDLVVAGGLIALLASFVILTLAWRRPRFEPARLPVGRVTADSIPGGPSSRSDTQRDSSGDSRWNPLDTRPVPQLVASPRAADAVRTGSAHPTGSDDGEGVWLLPIGLTRLVDAPAVRWIVRSLGLAVGMFMLAALLFGPDRLTNPAFGFVYVVVWVGLVPISLLLGPIWRIFNPVRSLHLILCRLMRLNPHQGLLWLPDRLGIWPATIGLAGFAWLELVGPDRATRSVLLLAVAIYLTVVLLGSIVFGQRWFGAADPFETYATTLAKLSPWTRSSQRRIGLTNPLRNLASLQPTPGRVAFLAVLLGSTGYDGFSGSSAWIGWAQNLNLPGVLIGTLALAAFIAIVYLTYSSAARSTRTVIAGTRSARSASQARPSLPDLFAHSLVPIALGYVVAHYLTLLILEGQRTVINTSDPFDLGWNLFGTATLTVNLAILNFPGLIGLAQAGAVVTGHVLGVVSAHDRALALFPARDAARSQLPLLLVMIGYTICGLLLLFSE